MTLNGSRMPNGTFNIDVKLWPTDKTIILESRFDINVGETVVAGTSRIQGDKALIVLLTAVPR